MPEEKLPSVVELRRSVATANRGQVDAFAGALRDAVGAIKQINADDISLEIDASQQGEQTNVRVRLRAYRRSDRK